MRPPSILMFERLFVASLGVSVLSFVLTYDQTMAQLDRMPELARVGGGAELVVGSVAIGVAIYLLLWFLIARKASNFAKWVLIVFVAIGVAFSVPAALAGQWDLPFISGLAVYALEIAAIVYLFRDDAKAWLRGEWNTDPAAFD